MQMIFLFVCKKNSPLPLGLDISLDLPFKAERKAMLKALRTSKKLKYMDDSKVVEEARLITLRDEWLITRGKPMLKTKAQMKKIAKTEKKKTEKENKAWEKAKKRARLWISKD